MNGQDIKRTALLHSGLGDIPEEYLIDFINQAMQELSYLYDTACKKDEIIVETEGDTWEYLGNIIAIKRAGKIIDETVTSPYYNFIYENDSIRFSDKGKYVVEVLEHHENLEKIENTPAINALFHLAIAYYVAYAETKRIFMHEDTNADYLLMQFREHATKAHKKLVFAKRTKKQVAYAPFI